MQIHIVTQVPVKRARLMFSHPSCLLKEVQVDPFVHPEWAAAVAQQRANEE